jgi:hypothetical protein
MSIISLKFVFKASIYDFYDFYDLTNFDFCSTSQLSDALLAPE